MSRPLDAILAHLEAAGIGVVGVSLFAGADVDLPTGAAAFLLVAETGGRGPIGTHQDPLTLRQPWFQIAARADLYPDAAALIDRAYQALSLTNLLIDDLVVLSARPVNEPAGIGTDLSGRPIISFNLETIVCRQAA